MQQDLEALLPIYVLHFFGFIVKARRLVSRANAMIEILAALFCWQIHLEENKMRFPGFEIKETRDTFKFFLSKSVDASPF